jgi:hypothetical protein
MIVARPVLAASLSLMIEAGCSASGNRVNPLGSSAETSTLIFRARSGAGRELSSRAGPVQGKGLEAASPPAERRGRTRTDWKEKFGDSRLLICHPGTVDYGTRRASRTASRQGGEAGVFFYLWTVGGRHACWCSKRPPRHGEDMTKEHAPLPRPPTNQQTKIDTLVTVSLTHFRGRQNLRTWGRLTPPAPFPNVYCLG